MIVASSKAPHKGGLSVYRRMVLYLSQEMCFGRGRELEKMHRFSGLGFFFNGFITRSKLKIDWLLSYLFKLHKHCNHYGYSNVKETVIQTDMLRFLHSNTAKSGDSVGNLYCQFSVQSSEHLQLMVPIPSLRKEKGRWKIMLFSSIWLGKMKVSVRF